MKRIKQPSILIIALLAMAMTNPAWADTEKPKLNKNSIKVSANPYGLSVTWDPATDNKTRPANMKYKIIWASDNLKTGRMESEMTGETSWSLPFYYSLANDFFYFRLCAIDEAGNMDETDLMKLKVVRDRTPPTKGKISFVGYTSNSFTVEWTPATDDWTKQEDIRYAVKCTKKSEKPSYVGYPREKKGLTRYTFNDITPGIEYQVRVRAFDNFDNYVDYNVFTVRIPDEKKAPTVPVITSVISTANTITLTWTPSTDDKTPQNKITYVVWYGTNGYKSVSPPAGVTSCTISNLEPNTEYSVFVASWDTDGNSAGGLEKAQKIRTQSSDTQAPTAGTYTTITSTTTITVNWTKGSDNVTPQNKLRYQVKWTKMSGGELKFSGYLTDITTYTITGLEPDTEYQVEVTVYDEALKYRNYGYRTVKTKAAADIQAPTAGSYGTITSTANIITVNWTRGTDNQTPQNKLRYRMFWKKKSASEWNAPPITTNITTYTLTGLEPNTEYEVNTTIFDEAGNFRWYGIRTVKTQAAAAADNTPPTPGGYGTITATTNTITVNWTKATDNETPRDKLKYYVAYETKVNYDNGEQLYGTTTKTNITTETLTGLKPNTEYKLEVQVFDEANNFRGYGVRTVKTKAAAVAVTGVTLSPSSLSLEVGQTGGLTATVAPSTATNKTITWSSSNAAVATVDASGTVKGIAPGTATITVKTADGNKTATATVTVKEATAPTVKVTSVTLNRNSVTINGDYEEIRLTATVAPATATDKSLTWSSDNPQVASVDGNGLVTIHRKGKARITVTANDGSLQYDVCDFDVIMTVGNETVDGLRVYAHGEALYLTLPEASTVHIYHVNGSMVKSLTLPAGDHSEPLTQGFYIVRIGERITKVMVK